MRIATYNLHGAVGRDGRCMPERVAAVIRELDADVVALQEVDSRRCGHDLLGYLAREAGYEHRAAGVTMTGASGDYGNGLLSRVPIESAVAIDLSYANKEPRGALDATVPWKGEPIRIVATHLGLSPAERRTQVRRLIEYMGADWRARLTVLLGDLNEWWTWGRPLQWLHAHFGAIELDSPATFPARFPLFALDRIWVEPRARRRALRVHRSALSRIASDHLPLVAEL